MRGPKRVAGGRTSFSDRRFSDTSCPPKSSPLPPTAGENDSPLLATLPVRPKTPPLPGSTLSLPDAGHMAKWA